MIGLRSKTTCASTTKTFSCMYTERLRKRSANARCRDNNPKKAQEESKEDSRPTPRDCRVVLKEEGVLLKAR